MKETLSRTMVNGTADVRDNLLIMHHASSCGPDSGTLHLHRKLLTRRPSFSLTT